MLNSMKDLQALVRTTEVAWEQYGDVRAIHYNELMLFNYTHAAHFNGRWNWFERVSRGLILNSVTGEIVARPFDKFFNWGERERKGLGHIVVVTEKLDGSLGILYRRNGDYRIATRGSFDGDQAMWATDFLNRNYNLSDLPESLTLLFEIIYPENRIVVDYGGREDLILLAARNRFNGVYLSMWPDLASLACHYLFPLPQVYEFNNIADILAAAGALDANHEGWVIVMSDGSRWKIKGDAYIEIHRLVTQASFKRVVEALAEDRLDDLLAGIPDELLGDVRQWQQQIQDTVTEITRTVHTAFANAPKGTRKQFALWVKDNHPDIAPYLFLMLDSRDFRSIIFKREF